MTPLEALESLEGIASRDELLRAGCWPQMIDLAVYYGRIRRIRTGWYATHDAPELAVRAWRIGGRLACISALELHEGAEGGRAEDGRAEDSRAEGGRVLHVLVPRGASRLRMPAEGSVLHWTRRTLPGSRLAVSAAIARSQRARCRGLA